MKCPFCKKEISKQAIASHIGSFKSEKKAQAARENGLKNIGGSMKIRKGTKSVNPRHLNCVVK